MALIHRKAKLTAARIWASGGFAIECEIPDVTQRPNIWSVKAGPSTSLRGQALALPVMLENEGALVSVRNISELK